VAPHPLGGPQPSFCDLEEHNALTAHQERQRRAGAEGRPRDAVDEEQVDPPISRIEEVPDG
jgi:hypothetical protein